MTLLETILALDGPYVVWLTEAERYEVSPDGGYIPYWGCYLGHAHILSKSVVPVFSDLEIDAALGGLGQ